MACPVDAGLRLNLRLTHQEIASAPSTTRVTVTRILGLRMSWRPADHPSRRAERSGTDALA